MPYNLGLSRTIPVTCWLSCSSVINWKIWRREWWLPATCSDWKAKSREGMLMVLSNIRRGIPCSHGPLPWVLFLVWTLVLKNSEEYLQWAWPSPGCDSLYLSTLRGKGVWNVVQDTERRRQLSPSPKFQPNSRSTTHSILQRICSISCYYINSILTECNSWVI